MRGSVRKRIAKDGTPRYDVIFRHAGKQVWKTFATRKAADDFLTDTVSDVNAGTYRRITPMLMSEVFTKWTASLDAAVALGQLKRSTKRSYGSIVTQHLTPAFGAVRSDALTTVAVSTWKTEAAQRIVTGELAAKTFNNCIGVFSACLDWARDHHYLSQDPLPKKLRAKPAGRQRDVVQGAEIGRLWQAATGQDRVIIALALFAGLRRGELFGVRWSDITWPKGRTRAAVRIAQAFVQRQFVTPKSAAGRRDVFLPARLVELLRQHRVTRSPVVLEDGASFIVRQDDGKPLDPDNWARRVWPVIRRAAKLPETVTLHALRHTFGSLLLADGVQIKHVSEQMGHANVAITLNVYQHVLRATSATATRQLDRHIPDQAPKKVGLRIVRRGAA
jgi:integrase